MIPFVKAHACGNDFLVVQEDLAGIEPRDELTRRLCHRNQGIGADGVEFLTWEGERRGRIRLHNADGSIAEISGNGTRCVAAWIAYETKAGPGDEIVLETDAGRAYLPHRQPHRPGSFASLPRWACPRCIREMCLSPAGRGSKGAVVSTGNPHFVIFVDTPDFRCRLPLGDQLEKRSAATRNFPHQTNVEFVRMISRDEIEIRIYERGVGPTSSSGTGTCAAGSAAIALRGARRRCCA